MPDASIPDRPPDGRTPDGTGGADAGPSITVAAVELHGIVPLPPSGTLTPVMKPAVTVSTTPADFTYDFGGGGVPGCSAFAYDLTAATPKLPPPTYDIGSVVVSMYTGTALGSQSMVTCADSAAGYECNFPSGGIYPESATPANQLHWLGIGDRPNLSWTGGSGIAALNMQLPSSSPVGDNFTAGSIVGKQGSVNTTGCTGTNTVQLQGNTGAWDFAQDLLVKFDCGGQACGLVAVSMSASQANGLKGANATCTALITSANNNCVKMPTGALTVLNYGPNGWDQIQTSVVHFGVGWTQASVAGSAGATIGAARGNFFIRVP